MQLWREIRCKTVSRNMCVRSRKYSMFIYLLSVNYSYCVKNYEKINYIGQNKNIHRFEKKKKKVVYKYIYLEKNIY